MTDGMDTWLKIEPFLRLFVRDGYVLDFTTSSFDEFTKESVGIPLCEYYQASKGKSLERFVRTAPESLAYKLLSDLMKYYENVYRDFAKEQKDLNIQHYRSVCKDLLSEYQSTPSSENASMYFNVLIGALSNPDWCRDRIFEATDFRIVRHFKTDDGAANFRELYQLPTIVADEFEKDDAGAIAKIGYLGPYPSMRLESVIAEFPASLLCQTLPGLDNKRTRWNIYSGDPYRSLGNISQRYHPVKSSTVMQFPDVLPQPNQIAVMMPFSKAYTSDIDPVYLAIKDAADRGGFNCKRVDELKVPSDINIDIVNLIESSRIVVVDLSGTNPNVCYEMGLAVGRGRIVIPICEKQGSDIPKLPFDIQTRRTIFYNRDRYGFEGLTNELFEALQNV